MGSQKDIVQCQKKEEHLTTELPVIRCFIILPRFHA